MRSAFITWYPYCRRSDTIAAAIGGPSHLVHYLSFKRPLQAPFKYVLQTAKTLQLLRRERPDLIFVAVPPIFAALPVLLFARRYGAKVVVDAHTGIFAHARWRWLMPLTRFVLRCADAVVVTGAHLQTVVAEWGARAFVISDVPVRFVEGRAPAACSGPRVVVINTFSVDEPVAEVLAAAQVLPEVCFFVTGDTRYADPALLASAGPNVTFTGFVSEEEYAGLLRAADVVTVLTTHDHTMQRGGYEAVALDKPLVTSNWGLLRETFSRGTIHVANAATAIADGIRTAVRDRSRLAAEMKSLRDERRQLFDERLAALLAAVGECRTSEEMSRPGKVGDRQLEGSR